MKDIDVLLNFCDREIQANQLAKRILTQLGDKLSDDCSISQNGLFWIYPRSRSDVEILLSLAPRWSKHYRPDSIDYSALVDGIMVTLKTAGDALPSSCKLVEEEVEVPAEAEVVVPAKPARMVRKLVMRCAGTPTEASS